MDRCAPAPGRAPLSWSCSVRLRRSWPPPDRHRARRASRARSGRTLRAASSTCASMTRCSADRAGCCCRTASAGRAGMPYRSIGERVPASGRRPERAVGRRRRCGRPLVSLAVHHAAIARRPADRRAAQPGHHPAIWRERLDHLPRYRLSSTTRAWPSAGSPASTWAPPRTAAAGRIARSATERSTRAARWRGGTCTTPRRLAAVRAPTLP